MFNKHTVLIDVPMHFSGFLRKAYSKVDFRHIKISDTIFLGQSLLSSTTILNDTLEYNVL